MSKAIDPPRPGRPGWAIAIFVVTIVMDIVASAQLKWFTFAISGLGLVVGVALIVGEAPSGPVFLAIGIATVGFILGLMRLRVQRAVDQRFDRARYDAERSTAAFAEQLRDVVDVPALASELDTTVRHALAPSRVGLWIRGNER